jgi:hypothetical protein
MITINRGYIQGVFKQIFFGRVMAVLATIFVYTFMAAGLDGVEIANYESVYHSLGDKDASGYSSTAVQAKKHISKPQAERDVSEAMIYANSWGLTLALDGSGFYNDLIKTAFSDMDNPPKYLPIPYSRAKAMFLTNGKGCLYPSTREVLKRGKEIGDESDFIETVPFLTARVFILAGAGRPVYRPGLDLTGRIVVHARGSAIATVMEGSGATFLAASDELDKARLLTTGRVDYILATLPDAAFVFQKLNEPLPAFDPDSEFFKGGIGVVCHKTPKNSLMIERLNDAFMHQLRSGTLLKLFENVPLNASDYLPVID